MTQIATETQSDTNIIPPAFGGKLMGLLERAGITVYDVFLETSLKPALTHRSK